MESVVIVRKYVYGQILGLEMKKFVFFCMALLCFSACKTDLSEIEERIDEIERQGKNLEQQGKNLEQQGKDLENKSKDLEQQGQDLADETERLQNDLDNTQNRIDEIEKEMNKVEPKLLSMEFLASENPLLLVENTRCDISADGIVECWVVNIMSSKKLIPHFTYQGENVTIGGKAVESGVTEVDFSQPVVMTITSSDKTKDYTINVHSYTGLPILWIETMNRSQVSVVERFYNAQFKLAENVTTRSSGSVIEASGKIKGIGSTQWWKPNLTGKTYTELWKNTYELQFNGVISVLDEAKNKAWALIPNADDITMLRNQTAYAMGKISKLAFTPRFHYVDVMMNGVYFGTYMIGDKIEVGADRVNISKDGFILKIDAKTSGTNFSAQTIEKPLSIIAPSVSSGDANYKYIKNFITTAEDALFSEDFTNTSTGWQKYLDMDSFVDWYLINEIAKNSNGAFAADCYMTLERDGKLKMGPIWNFENAFGNVKNTSSNGFVVKNSNWYARLFKDPAFVTKVKERFNYFYKQRNTILSEINSNAQYLRYSVRENSNKWEVFDSYKSYSSDVSVMYQNAVGSMKSWLDKRMTWLKGEFDKM